MFIAINIQCNFQNIRLIHFKLYHELIIDSVLRSLGVIILQINKANNIT